MTATLAPTTPTELSEPASLILPSPPSDHEKYAYVTPGSVRQRWLMMGGALSASLFAYRVFATAPSAFSVPAIAIAITLILKLILGLFTSLLRSRYSMAQHIGVVGSYAPSSYPTVAVFLPSCGEDMEILYNTYEHVSHLDWPGQVRVYVLDDSDRSVVREAACRYGYSYHVRPNRGHMKKAGNLLFGYEMLTDEQYILVLDADFVPRPDMLREMIPYFAQDPRLGIVQSPQFFDTGGRMNWLQSGAGAVQEVFYRWVQPSRDRLGSPICVGTCAIYSVEALRAAGGFAQIEHSEDVHTGVKLRRAGYLTRYIPINLSKGVCPDEMRSFINQQYRWCAGSMSLLRDAAFHKIDMGLKSKLCFWSGFAYYISTAILVIVTPIPMTEFLLIHHGPINPVMFYAFIPALLFSMVLIPSSLHARWGLEVLRVQYIYSFAHALAIYDTFLKGKTAAWVPTGAVKKGNSLDRRVKRVMVTWMVLSQVFLIGSLAVATLRLGFSGVWPYFIIMGLQLLIQFPILLPLSSPYAHRDRLRALVTSPRKLGLAVTILGALAAISACSKPDTHLPTHSEVASVPHIVTQSAGFRLDFTGPAGTKPPQSFFGYDYGGGGWGNGEAETYTGNAANAQLDGNGNLVITAQRNSQGWTSARLTTRGKWSYTYGTLTARIKAAPGSGIWPAFWLLGTNGKKWPASGEIDVAEFEKATHAVAACTHAGSSHWFETSHCKWILGPTAYSDQFHTYSVTREPNFVEVDLDGHPLNIVHRRSGEPWPFNGPMNLILNVAVGGVGGGHLSAATPNPSSMVIDWLQFTGR